ncbi:MAG: hypothetical protein H0U44_03145 [Flavisolibacter sp.]|jgi:hypothetical protein|nr:hypothetical protein [Flavisolibacter sp.]
MQKLNLLILLVLGFVSCRYNKEEVLFPNSYCNTNEVRYGTTIKGIIAQYNCMNCHGATNPFAGFSLHTYDALKAKVTDGRLLGAVSHSPGFSPMPQGAARMSQCDINKIKKWIDDGAPNN